MWRALRKQISTSLTRPSKVGLSIAIFNIQNYPVLLLNGALKFLDSKKTKFPQIKIYFYKGTTNNEWVQEKHWSVCKKLHYQIVYCPSKFDVYMFLNTYLRMWEVYRKLWTNHWKMRSHIALNYACNLVSPWMKSHSFFYILFLITWNSLTHLSSTF